MMLNSPIFSSERQPISRVLTLTLIIGAIIATFLLEIKSHAAISSTTWIFAVISIALVITGWLVLDKDRSRAESNGTNVGTNTALFSRGMLIIVAGAMVASTSSYFNRLGLASSISFMLTFFAIGFYDQYGRKSRLAGLILAPILCGSLFTSVAGVLGNPVIGIFPGVIAALLVLVLRVTLEIEREIVSVHGTKDDETIYHMYRRRLAWTAGAFFMFGVVSFWPWLGGIYGNAYFWLLILGVILPLVFFWGRLRQPRSEGAQTALIRFNRIAPFIAFVLLLAFVIG